eukprot:CAMPEP_0194424768 /NCGR_PEP_ID=MMETSP0176-20130528/24079_1 /TAXON_ID=216777 /ORGANISM="Proboscia alata, Strain PI-D3" /LENGTH=507 /DNA_ID=CAMNT_0039234743 /DNA_START=142 /DNA_END=1665 /DNA_ORIENTATION=-
MTSEADLEEPLVTSLNNRKTSWAPNIVDSTSFDQSAEENSGVDVSSDDSKENTSSRSDMRKKVRRSIFSIKGFNTSSSFGQSAEKTFCIDVNVDDSKENASSRSGFHKKAQVWTLNNWIEYSYFTLLALFIQVIVGSGDWAFPDDIPGGTEDNSRNTRICELQGTSKICELQDTFDIGVVKLTFINAILVGGFLTSSVKLWLLRRSSYTALLGSTRNLLLNLTCMIEDKQSIDLVTRWTVLGFELSVMKARGAFENESESISYLTSLHLLQSDEWLKMVEDDRLTTVWLWIQTKARELCQANCMSEMEFQTICNAITVSRSAANDMMSTIDRDQPPPYVFVCAALVNSMLFLQSVAAGFSWAIFMHDSGGFKIWLEPKMYVEVIILLIWSGLYAMLFDACTLLYNPFGSRSIDIQHYKCSAVIRKLAKGLNDTWPETIERSKKRLETSNRLLQSKDSWLGESDTFIQGGNWEHRDFEMSMNVEQERPRIGLFRHSMKKIILLNRSVT